MFQNNTELEAKTKCIKQKLSQHKVAENVGTSGIYVSRIINYSEKTVNQASCQ